MCSFQRVCTATISVANAPQSKKDVLCGCAASNARFTTRQWLVNDRRSFLYPLKVVYRFRMPFINHRVSPVYLSKQKISSDKVQNELDAVCNNTLVQTVRQMACLVRLADDIFARVYSEFCVINQRSRNIQLRLANITDVVDALDAKCVDIREYNYPTFCYFDINMFFPPLHLH